MATEIPAANSHIGNVGMGFISVMSAHSCCSDYNLIIKDEVHNGGTNLCLTAAPFIAQRNVFHAFTLLTSMNHTHARIPHSHTHLCTLPPLTTNLRKSVTLHRTD